MDLKKTKNIYFIGIGGIGMSAIARMFLLEGKKVSGSDLADSEITDELEKLGAQIEIGEPKKEIPNGVDLVVYTVAIPENHSEFQSAKKKGVQTISYPETLALISKDKFTIAVAGTHGKTTTTAMIAQILTEAGLDPTVIVGSLLKNSKSNFVSGKSKYLVVEACEYKRSFLNLHPDIAVITNIDDDHLDYYGDLAGVQKGFKEFIGQIKSNGFLVTDFENEKVKPVLKSAGDKAIDYSSIQEKITLSTPGKHNVQNAKAALVAAGIVGIPKEKAIESLRNFGGTWRRFEDRGETETRVRVYDDYAHHPAEISATLKGAREKFSDKKIVVAFQPHLYSRTKEHLNEFGPALKLADEIIILPIYAAREPADQAITSEILTNKLKSDGLKATYFKDFSSAEKYLKSHLKAGQVLLTMGAGDINKLTEMMLKY